MSIAGRAAVRTNLAVAVVVLAASVPGLFQFLAMLPGTPLVKHGLEFPGILFGLVSPLGLLVAAAMLFFNRRALSRTTIAILGVATSRCPKNF